MTDSRIEVVLVALRGGNTRTAAAAYAQISRETFYRWLHDDVTFHDAIEKAEADAEARAVAIVIRAAQGGTWQAAAWWLERRRSDVFALRMKTELTGADGGPIETKDVTAGFDDHEKRALVRAVQRELAAVEGGPGEAASVVEGAAVAHPREVEPATS